MKLAINTDAISQDFETAVLLGLEWGVEHFELKRMYGRRVPDITDDEVKAVENALRVNGAYLSSIAPGLFKVPLDKDQVALEGGKRLDQSVALAHRLRTTRVVIFGFVRDARPADEAFRQVIDALGRAAARAEKEGLTLYLENDRGLWGETPADVRRILSGVGSKALRLNWDPGNLIGAVPEAPYPTGYELVREFVGHVHVKDAKDAGIPKFAHAMMGAGDVDWVGQFERLMRDGYDGYAVIEPHFGSRVSSSRDHVLATRKVLRAAQDRLRAARG